MTRDQQLEAIRAACIKANPEIAGTHIFADGYPNYCTGCRAPRIVRDVDRKICRVSKEGGSVSDVTVTEYKTEGQPCPAITRREIRLSDVLLAIARRTDHGDIAITADGRILKKGYTLKNEPLGYCWDGIQEWNLLLDDVTLQSDECVALLAGLLPKQAQV